MRVSKKDYESEEARKFGGLDRWYHLPCFTKLRSELQYFDEGTTLAGSAGLSKEDKAELKKQLPKIKAEDVPPAAKKIKGEPEDDQEEKQLKAQNKKIFTIRDKLSQLTKGQLTELLEENSQAVPVGQSEVCFFFLFFLCFC